MPLPERLSRLTMVWALVEAHPTGKFIVITPSKIRVRDLGNTLMS
jgi:hypothetical protein